LKLIVDEETIDQSIKRDSSHCMIAEAVKAAFPDAQSVSVDVQTIRLSDPTKRLRYTYLTPRIAQVAIIKFDQGDKPEPFEVTLRNAQVTRMADSSRIKMKTGPKGRGNLVSADAQNPLRQASLRAQSVGSSNNTVPDKIGGQTPPMQQVKDKESGKEAPFSRRRAFGLRGMDL
jgi:hypothetical protein